MMVSLNGGLLGEVVLEQEEQELVGGAIAGEANTGRTTGGRRTRMRNACEDEVDVGLQEAEPGEPNQTDGARAPATCEEPIGMEDGEMNPTRRARW